MVQKREFAIAEEAAVAAFVPETFSNRSHNRQFGGLLLLRIVIAIFGVRIRSTTSNGAADLLVAAQLPLPTADAQ